MSSENPIPGPKSMVTLLTGSEAMTVAGMERIYTTLTGKSFTDHERTFAQQKIDFRNSTIDRPTDSGQPNGC